MLFQNYPEFSGFIKWSLKSQHVEAETCLRDGYQNINTAVHMAGFYSDLEGDMRYPANTMNSMIWIENSSGLCVIRKYIERLDMLNFFSPQYFAHSFLIIEKTPASANALFDIVNYKLYPWWCRSSRKLGKLS